MLVRQETALDEDMPIKRPVCPTCDVPMWLTKILPHASGDRLRDRYCFECKVCDSAAVLPSLND
jgi:hypothetical protein